MFSTFSRPLAQLTNILDMSLMPGIDLASLRGTKHFAYPHVDAAWKLKKKSDNETVLLEDHNKSATNCVKRACKEAVKDNFFKA